MAVIRRFTRGAGPVGLALTAVDLWLRLPPQQRQQVMRMTRKHGPRVARAVASRARPKPKP